MINIVELILSGLFVGIGSALGIYFANKGLIKQIEKLMNKLNHGRKS